MIRIIIVGIFAALVTACTGPNTTDPGAKEHDAEAFKHEMDAEAARLLPDLI